MHVLFVEPRFPANQRQFVRGLAEAGARVTGIGEAPVEALGPDLQRWLSGYEQVGNVTSEQQLFDITLEEALAVYAQPKYGARGASSALKEFDADPVSGKPIKLK